MRFLEGIACVLVFLAIGGMMAGDARSVHEAIASELGQLPYHLHPPVEPPPTTLDPMEFRSNPNAFVAYVLAGRAKNTLYQVPCFCPCNKEEGHQSLLDCFTTRHGVSCHICQKEAVFCFMQTQKGKTPAQIRHAMTRRAFKNFDLREYVERVYPALQHSEK
jgi:uncharacterized protein with PCYCGC motif